MRWKVDEYAENRTTEAMPNELCLMNVNWCISDGYRVSETWIEIAQAGCEAF